MLKQNQSDEPLRYLVRQCLSSESFELLQALSDVDLGRVEVAARVDREIVRPVEVSRVLAESAEVVDDGQRRSVEDPDDDAVPRPRRLACDV